MPRENRKRGKKHKKSATNEEDYNHIDVPVIAEEEPQQEAGPSWITRAPNPNEDREAPFGYVDSEVKAYFRTVDVQIREWQEVQDIEEDMGDSDPNEDRRLFFVAALNEMSDKEKQLATDPDCSGILERMSYSMDDFARRVFVDRLSGSYEQLVRHRFASHVCQTLFTVASDTITRECRGLYPASNPEESEELRTMSQLVLDVCEELAPVFSSLVLDPFASHVIRALLSLLVPGLSTQQATHGNSSIRSKKSAAYKAKQGSFKSVFTSESDRTTSVQTLRPEGFRAAAKRFVMDVREKLGENEVRALAANQVASPVLQLLLEIEVEESLADEPGSLMDAVLAGLITALHEDEDATPEASDYVGTLLRDPTSSHLLETLVSRTPPRTFDALWATYFRGKLARLAVHPVANFVVSKALMQLNAAQLKEACEEVKGVSGKILKAARIGVFRALVERASALNQEEEPVVETICATFGLKTAEDRSEIVPCVLRLTTLQEYQTMSTAEHAQGEDRPSHGHRSHKKEQDPAEPKTQGALLLQSMLSLSASYNSVVVDSISSRDISEVLTMSRHATSSRVFDALLDSSSVSTKAKRQFVMRFIGHYHTLVDDRIGSRVGDRCWAYADPYLKQKIARSLLPHEQDLAASFYGKFFARRLNLQLLRKDTEHWKTLQIASKAGSSAAPVPVSEHPATSNSTKRKRGDRPEDEIEQLFNGTLGKKIKKAELAPEANEGKRAPVAEGVKEEKGAKAGSHDRGLDDVMGAIKAAPKSEVRTGKKKKTK